MNSYSRFFSDRCSWVAVVLSRLEVTLSAECTNCLNTRTVSTIVYDGQFIMNNGGRYFSTNPSTNTYEGTRLKECAHAIINSTFSGMYQIYVPFPVQIPALGIHCQAKVGTNPLEEVCAIAWGVCNVSSFILILFSSTNAGMKLSEKACL